MCVYEKPWMHVNAQILYIYIFISTVDKTNTNFTSSPRTIRDGREAGQSFLVQALHILPRDGILQIEPENEVDAEDEELNHLLLTVGMVLIVNNAREVHNECNDRCETWSSMKIEVIYWR